MAKLIQELEFKFKNMDSKISDKTNKINNSYSDQKRQY